MSRRRALRAAQRERDVLRGLRARVSNALARASDLTATISAKLAEFSDVDKAIADACAASILRSTHAPTELTLDLSPELKKGAERKFFLENQLAATRQAAERLGQDLAAAESDLQNAERAVEEATIAVAASEIEPIAAELAQIENRAAQLRCVLFGYGAQRNADGFLPMSRSVAQLLRRAPKNAGVEGGADHLAATARWRAYLQELRVDGDAAFDAEPTQRLSPLPLRETLEATS